VQSADDPADGGTFQLPHDSTIGRQQDQMDVMVVQLVRHDADQNEVQQERAHADAKARAR